jgi:zinc/manganese transport system permease protein
MMNSWWSMLPWWLAPLLALGLGLVVLAPLGVQVLKRGVVFIDLAVAQAAAAAALWWSSAMDHPGPWSTRAAACAGALLAAWWVRHLAQRHATQREALIGLVYVLSAALAVLGASQDPHGREHLAALLAADVLWADWPQVALMAALAAGSEVWRRAIRARVQSPVWRDALFYGWFAVVASMAVGVLGFVAGVCRIDRACLAAHSGLELCGRVPQACWVRVLWGWGCRVHLTGPVAPVSSWLCRHSACAPGGPTGSYWGLRRWLCADRTLTRGGSAR